MADRRSPRVPGFTADPVRALGAVRWMERRSGSLRDLPPRPGAWRQRGRLLVRGDLDTSILRIDVAGDRWTEIGDPPRLAADAVLLSSIPGALIGCRAFYVEPGLTGSVRGAGLRRSRIIAGSRVAARFAGRHGDAGLVVPHQLDRGRGLRRAYVLEESLPGDRVRGREWPDHVERVIDGLARLWPRSEPRSHATGDVVPWLGADRVDTLLGALDVDVRDRRRMLEGVARLARSTDRLLVGWTHGDPVPNNVLRLDDGRLALVDWERAGRNPLGLDACRLLAPLDDPRPATAQLEHRFAALRSPRTLPLPAQAAIALLSLLPTWLAQREAWHAAGRARAYRNRNARRVRLLETLLDA